MRATAKRVRLCFVEPWELSGTLRGLYTGVLEAEFVNPRGAKDGLIRMDNELEYQGHTYRWLLASPRYAARDLIVVLTRGKAVVCAELHVDNPADRRQSLYRNASTPGTLRCICEMELLS